MTPTRARSAKQTTDITSLLYLVFNAGAALALQETGVSKLEEQKLFLQNKNFASLRTLEVKRALEQLQKLRPAPRRAEAEKRMK